MPQTRREARQVPTRGAGRRRRIGSDRLITALAGLAHEVRTPLNGVLAMAELLAASDLPAREREWASALTQAAEHLANLTAVIVDGARAEIGTLAPKRAVFDTHQFALALGQSLRARTQVKGLAAEVDIAADLPWAAGDPVLLRAAIENLLDNAVKFTERGRVTFRCMAEPVTGPKVRLRFTIIDEGIGLTPVQIRRLFRPFTQAHPGIASRYGGAGLGLAFTRQIARAMGGYLTVSGQITRGSAFELEAVLGVVERPGIAPNPTDGTPENRPDSSRVLRVLCAEDNPYGRVMLKAITTSLGHQIDFVGDGEAAVQALAAKGYDLVLMDVTLAGMSGIEATRRIRALDSERRHVPVIGISGRGEPAEEKAARSAGMTEYLVKPVSPNTLAAAIAALSRA